MRDDLERLRDILKAIDHILDKTIGGDPHSTTTRCYASGSFITCRLLVRPRDRFPQSFVSGTPIRCGLKRQACVISWYTIISEINAIRIWNVVQEDLPSLRDRVESLLREQS